MGQQSNDRFKEYFSRIDRTKLFDGATGTQLMLMGIKPRDCAELWNLTNPDKIRYVAQLYFDAGSDAVLTNTFGAISTRLKIHDLEKSVYELNRAGAKLAKSVCPSGKFVIGNIGPLGEFLQPLGDLSEKDAIEAYREQVRGLIDGGVDAFSLETFAGLKEMECAIKAIKYQSNLPYLCSMTFKPTPRGYYTEMGVSVQKAVENLVIEGAFAIGSNCSNGIENMIEIARQIREISSDSRMIIQPNAGKPRLVNGMDVYDETPEHFVRHLPKLLSYRPIIIGGCCGTTPRHIRMMREFLDRTYR